MLNELYDNYKDRVAFYIVYIQEAHASNGWQMSSNVRRHVVFEDPTALDERARVAGTCVTKLNVRIPALIDDMQNSTEKAYTAWPDRLYLLDREGRIHYKSDAGPFGFNPEDLEKKLKEMFPGG